MQELRVGVQPLLSIVAPMFNEEGNVERFVTEVGAALADQELGYELVLVDDGSRDGTWIKICELARRDRRVRGLSLSRNFGHQNALFAGLHCAQGRAIVSMDGDLQHPPRVILELLAAWRAGHDVVTTSRRDSADTSLFKRTASRGFYRVFSRLTGVALASGTSDFRLIDARVRDALLEMRDTDLFLRGIVSWLGFRTANVAYQADVRHAGQTKYTLPRMVRFSTGAMLAFSMLPLKLGIWLGFFTCLMAFLEIGYVVFHYFKGNTVPGWASVMVVMSLMFSVVFMLLGAIGVYIGKIFEILKGRQRFVVAHYAGFEEAPAVLARSS